MDLGKHIVDKEVLGGDGLRAGKVDDLVLEVPDLADPTELAALPEVRAILTGPTALSQTLSRPVRWLVRAGYRLLGVADPRPVEIPWDRVLAIDVVVHIDADRAIAGWSTVGEAVNRRFISKLPGA